MEYEIGYKKRRFTWPEGRNTEEQNEQYNPSTPNISFGSIASTQHLRSNIVRTPEKILKHVAYPVGFIEDVLVRVGELIFPVFWRI